MPLKPMRPCAAPGCGTLTRGKYCESHRTVVSAGKIRKASSAWHWMYGTELWRRCLRPGQLMREPFCRECARLGLRTKATVVDHVIPHEGDWRLFCDEGNLQSLCKSHHDAKTMRELLQKRRKQTSAPKR